MSLLVRFFAASFLSLSLFLFVSPNESFVFPSVTAVPNPFLPIPPAILSALLPLNGGLQYGNLNNNTWGVSMVSVPNAKYEYAVIYCNGYASGLIITPTRVYLIDSPNDVAPFILAGVQSVIGKRNVDYFIYTHAHKDHNEDIATIQAHYPSMITVGHDKTNQVLAQKAQPTRPLPSMIVYDTGYDFGDGVTLVYHGDFHSVGGLVVKSEAMCFTADLFNPGFSPYFGIGGKGINPGALRHALSYLLSWTETTVYITAHAGNYIGTKTQLQAAIDFMSDLQTVVGTAFGTVDFTASAIAANVSFDNTMATTWAYQNAIINVCEQQMLAMWTAAPSSSLARSYSYPNMAAVDTAIYSNCETMYWYLYMEGPDSTNSELVLSGMMKTNGAKPNEKASAIYLLTALMAIIAMRWQ